MSCRRTTIRWAMTSSTTSDKTAEALPWMLLQTISNTPRTIFHGWFIRVREKHFVKSSPNKSCNALPDFSQAQIYRLWISGRLLAFMMFHILSAALKRNIIWHQQNTAKNTILYKNSPNFFIFIDRKRSHENFVRPFVIAIPSLFLHCFNEISSRLCRPVLFLRYYVIGSTCIAANLLYNYIASGPFSVHYGLS